MLMTIYKGVLKLDYTTKPGISTC